MLDENYWIAARMLPLSRWTLIFVVEARQRAKGFYAEGSTSTRSVTRQKGRGF